jgi:hypothetical protein
VEVDAHCQLGVGGGNDEYGSLNLKHGNLFSMNAFGSPARAGARTGLIEAVEEVWVRYVSQLRERAITIRWP